MVPYLSSRTAAFIHTAQWSLLLTSLHRRSLFKDGDVRGADGDREGGPHLRQRQFSQTVWEGHHPKHSGGKPAHPSAPPPLSVEGRTVLMFVKFTQFTLHHCLLLLQAMIRGELEVLKDWCYEAVSSVLQVLTTLDSSSVMQATSRNHSLNTYTSV